MTPSFPFANAVPALRSVSRRVRAGFTLVELLVAMTVLAVLLAIISQVLATVQKSWRNTSAKVSQFREARRAFDVIKRNLSQATLNTYLHYDFGGNKDQATGFIDTTATPTGYLPFSELQFVCGPASKIQGISLDPSVNPGHAVFFQANLGFSDLYPNLPTTLNPRGYFIEYGDDEALRPSFLAGKVKNRVRYRLMEYAPPTEANTIYDRTKRNSGSNIWYQDIPRWSRPVSDNVIALFLAPKRPRLDGAGDPYSIATEFYYDSATPGTGQRNAPHELPPQLEVIMVVIDEASAEMLATTESDSSTPPLDLGQVFLSASEKGIREDLEQVKQVLIEKNVNYRVFVSTITLPNSKWRG
jgi:uncharacterized protein (TIGR02599 family)